MIDILCDTSIYKLPNELWYICNTILRLKKIQDEHIDDIGIMSFIFITDDMRMSTQRKKIKDYNRWILK